MAIFLITGDPGVGKTTAVIRVAERLKEKGFKVAGIVSRELRKNGVRIGFEFVDFVSDETVTLASTSESGSRIGRYHIDLNSYRFAVEKFKDAFKYDIIICDELGPMEFKSEEFVDCAGDMLELDKHMIIVIHKRLRHPVIAQFRRRAELLIDVDLQNRNKVPDLLLGRLS